MDTENCKYYEEMTREERMFAIHSARYILEDIPMEKIAEISGLPMGVIYSAYHNIFVGNSEPMKVRCIDVDGLGTNDDLKVGEIYTVSYHNHNGHYYNLKEINSTAWYCVDRFEVVE